MYQSSNFDAQVAPGRRKPEGSTISAEFSVRQAQFIWLRGFVKCTLKIEMSSQTPKYPTT